MNAQLDWIGGLEQKAKAFKDIRGTRPSVAEEKARLALELGRLCMHVPQCVRDGSINKTREWHAAQAAAIKVANSKRASVQELTAAISNMRRFL